MRESQVRESPRARVDMDWLALLVEPRQKHTLLQHPPTVSPHNHVEATTALLSVPSQCSVQGGRALQEANVTPRACDLPR